MWDWEAGVVRLLQTYAASTEGVGPAGNPPSCPSSLPIRAAPRRLRRVVAPAGRHVPLAAIADCARCGGGPGSGCRLCHYPRSCTANSFQCRTMCDMLHELQHKYTHVPATCPRITGLQTPLRCGRPSRPPRLCCFRGASLTAGVSHTTARGGTLRACLLRALTVAHGGNAGSASARRCAAWPRPPPDLTYFLASV